MKLGASWGPNFWRQFLAALVKKNFKTLAMADEHLEFLLAGVGFGPSTSSLVGLSPQPQGMGAESQGAAILTSAEGRLLLDSEVSSTVFP